MTDSEVALTDIKLLILPVGVCVEYPTSLYTLGTYRTISLAWHASWHPCIGEQRGHRKLPRFLAVVAVREKAACAEQLLLVLLSGSVFVRGQAVMPIPFNRRRNIVAVDYNVHISESYILTSNTQKLPRNHASMLGVYACLKLVESPEL